MKLHGDNDGCLFSSILSLPAHLLLLSWLRKLCEAKGVANLEAHACKVLQFVAVKL